MKLGYHSVRATKYVALIIYISLLQILSANSFEYRCMWVVRDIMTSSDKIDKLLQFAEDNNINHLLVQVRGRGDAFYSSQLVPRSDQIEVNGFDPLNYILNEAHQRGLKIHAWINVYLIWSSSRQPASPAHVFNLYPQWVDTDGQKTLEQMVKQYDGVKNQDEGFYLAPHHPEVPKYIKAVVREIVAKYPIDGLHLDYVRYKDSDYGINPTAIKEFKKKNGNDSMVFLNTRRKYANPDGTLKSKINTWNEHKNKSVTSLVKDIKSICDEVRPGCLVSAAVKPDLYSAKSRFSQEWDVWLAAGYLDLVFPMNYTSSIRSFAKNIDIIYDNLPKKYRDRIVMGVATYNQTSLDAADKIKYTKITRFPGVCIFSYNVLAENPRYFQSLKKVLTR